MGAVVPGRFEAQVASKNAPDIGGDVGAGTLERGMQRKTNAENGFAIRLAFLLAFDVAQW